MHLFVTIGLLCLKGANVMLAGIVFQLGTTITPYTNRVAEHLYSSSGSTRLRELCDGIFYTFPRGQAYSREDASHQRWRNGFRRSALESQTATYEHRCCRQHRVSHHTVRLVTWALLLQNSTTQSGLSIVPSSWEMAGGAQFLGHRFTSVSCWEDSSSLS